MRKFTLIFAVIIVMVAGINSVAQVHGSVELQNRVDKSGVTPTVDVYAEGPVKGKLGWSCFALKTQGWGQVYCGPTYSPNKSITISGSVGVQEGPKTLRFADSVWIGKGKWSALHIDEYRGGYWTKNVVKYQATKSVAIGGYAQSFIGVGPYAEVNWKKMTVWGTVGVGTGQPKGIIGVKYNF